MSPSRTALVGGVDVPLDHYVDGARVGSATTFEDRSPIDWSMLLGEVARGDADTAAAALGAATAAAPGWAALGVEGRAAILHRLADLIDARTEELAIVECLDMAMLHESLRARVIGRGARNFRAYADLAVAYEPRRWSSNGTDNAVLRMPAGPTVVITPWNAPFMLSTWKTAPALAAGNTVVLKPAEWSPLSCSLLCDLAEAAGMPARRPQRGPGTRRRGRAPPWSPTPARGGSASRARRRPASRSASRPPATSCPSPPSSAARGRSSSSPTRTSTPRRRPRRGCTTTRGRSASPAPACSSTSSVHDAFFERFREATDAHVLGDPRDAATTISPLIHPDHLARVEGFVERARAAGDEIAFGGRRWKDDALWYEPTLVLPRSNDAEIVQAEVFGPVLTLQRFDDEDEAIALANSTRYGLSAMVFTADAARAARCSEAIRAGTIWTNCFLVRDLTAPFGGCGISGIGREGGDYALDFYSELKTSQVKEGTTHG